MKFSYIAMALSMCAFSVYASSPNPGSLPPMEIQAKPSKINLNTVDLSKLSHAFRGIGQKRAEAIIAYRVEHQGFKNLEELASVKGLGKRFVAANLEELKNTFIVV